jgi:hypothetical protein
LAAEAQLVAAASHEQIQSRPDIGDDSRDSRRECIGKLSGGIAGSFAVAKVVVLRVGKLERATERREFGRQFDGYKGLTSPMLLPMERSWAALRSDGERVRFADALDPSLGFVTASPCVRGTYLQGRPRHRPSGSQRQRSACPCSRRTPLSPAPDIRFATV